MRYSLLPRPQLVEDRNGCFNTSLCSISVAEGVDRRVIREAAAMAAALQKADGTHHALLQEDAPQSGICIRVAPSLAAEAYTLQIGEDRIVIEGGDAAGCFYGLQTLKQLIATSGAALPALKIEDHPDMAFRGYYHDASRGRIPTLSGVKRIIDRLAEYKINAFQLYVEHTYDFREFRDENRTQDDLLTAEDLIEIDSYCHDRFIDFIPSLSTFGHLYELLNNAQYRHLCELEDFKPEHHFWLERMLHHTIDPTNPESFALVCSLIDQYLPLFRSEYFNICCDETFDLGKGRNAGSDSGALYCDFVNRIIQYVSAKGKKVMMWGDIALEHPKALEQISRDIIFLNWDYAASPDRSKVARIAQHGVPQIVCPGTCSWKSLIENINVSIPNITQMAHFGYEHNALGLLNTNWGDYGHPCFFDCALFGTAAGACVSWNRDTVIDEAFELAASRLLYHASSNLIPLIRRLARSHETAYWWTLLHWTETRDAACLETDADGAEASARACRETAAALSAVSGDADILARLVSAAQGIALLNEAVAHILRGTDDTGWRAEVQAWLSRYEALWLQWDKPSELCQIRKFFESIL